MKPDELLPLTPPVLHILLALSEGPRHGYGIGQEVEQVTGGVVRMGPGTLYGSLSRMTEAGLIREAEPPGTEGGGHAERRRYYEITPLGVASLRADAGRLAEVVRLAEMRLGLEGGT